MKEKFRQYERLYRNGLLKDVIPFLEKYSMDHKYGGYFTCLDRNGDIYSTDKFMWLQARQAWMFSVLYNKVEKREQWLQWARHGIEFIRNHGFDSDGRMFYAVTCDGRPLRKRRYLFTECFGVIALAEYAKASGQEQTKQQACDLYQLILRYHTTPGLLEAKTITSTRQLKSHAMPMILVATTQVLRQIDEHESYTKVVDESIREILKDFLKPEFKVLLENVGPNGEFLDEPEGRQVNPGHAIETAWFIMEEAFHRNSNQELIDKACQILDWSLDIGWDTEYGGIYYFRDCCHKPCLQYEHDMKLWWPHNEAIYATLLAYCLTGQEHYAIWHRKIHNWAYDHFQDAKQGEWFGYLHRDGTLSSTLKGNMWKGPFHLPRMQLNCWKLLEKIRFNEKAKRKKTRNNT